jgi:hypothetical protein
VTPVTGTGEGQGVIFKEKKSIFNFQRAGGVRNGSAFLNPVENKVSSRPKSI